MSPAASGKAATLRNQNVEIVRIIAAFGIVVFHSASPGGAVGYSGLVAFAMLSSYFAGAASVKLARRIMLPWLFWSVFYLGWRFAADGSPFHPGLNPVESILYGTHLWYLPFIFVAILLASQLRAGWGTLICGVAASALLIATPWWRDIQMGFDPPVSQFLHALPAALIGVALRSRAGIIVAVAGLVVCAFWQVGGVSLPYAVGGGVVVAAILLPPIDRNVEAVSSCMLGVYLVHIAALGVFNRITGQGEILTPAAAFGASLVGVWVVRKFVPVSRTVLG